MKTKEILLIIILFLLAIGFSYFYNNNQVSEIEKVCFDDNCFDVEIADTNEERQEGLMFREFLAQDSGMLFIFDSPGIYSFWMKNTLISLDIIWIGEGNRVVFIQEGAQPCEADPCESYGPKEEALYVLEVNSGVSEKIGLVVGSEVKLK